MGTLHGDSSWEECDSMLIREARAGDARAIATVHVASWQTTYRGIVPDDYLAGLSVEQREPRWTVILADTTGPAGAACAFVADTGGGRVVGFADGGPRREGDPAFAGELYAIYLLAEYQGQGIGRRLVASVTERLHTLGMASLLVWALARNPACRFYEALGGRPIGRKPITIGGATLDEVAYGWPDTRILYAGAAWQ